MVCFFLVRRKKKKKNESLKQRTKINFSAVFWQWKIHSVSDTGKNVSSKMPKPPQRLIQEKEKKLLQSFSNERSSCNAHLN